MREFMKERGNVRSLAGTIPATAGLGQFAFTVDPAPEPPASA